MNEVVRSIGIVTINDPENYGNRLQNYALQQLLRKFSPVVNTLFCYTESSTRSALAEAVVRRRIVRPVKTALLRLSHGNHQLEGRRRKNFADFSARFINEHECSVSMARGVSPKRNMPQVVVLGSDQVWNEQWLSNDGLALRLGSFAPEGHILSYAASFGIDSVSDSSVPVFKKYLPRISDIAVREYKGAELVKSLSGQDATVVLDPTMMLSKDEWTSITKGFIPVGERYVLTYFLGKPTKEQEQQVQEYARKHHCGVRRILDFSDPKTYVADPRDFVELFAKAQFVFTDSYHACCFSLLFDKQFKVFTRSGMQGKASMNSRMETLFTTFELNKSMGVGEDEKPIDYGHVGNLLNQRRQESFTWLSDAFKALKA